MPILAPQVSSNGLSPRRAQTANLQGSSILINNNSDLEKLGPGTQFFRKLANLQRDVNALRKKQKADPNSKSLDRIIQKKEENIKQLQQIAEKRNQMVFGTISDIVQTHMGYFA